MATASNQRPERLRALVLLPLIIIFSLALTLIVVSTQAFFNYQIEEKSSATAQRARHNYETKITRDTTDILITCATTAPALT